MPAGAASQPCSRVWWLLHALSYAWRLLALALHTMKCLVGSGGSGPAARGRPSSVRAAWWAPRAKTPHGRWWRSCELAASATQECDLVARGQPAASSGGRGESQEGGWDDDGGARQRRQEAGGGGGESVIQTLFRRSE